MGFNGAPLVVRTDR